MKVINLTPHTITFADGTQIEASGTIARVQETLKQVEGHEITQNLGFPVLEQRLSEVEVNGLPFPESKRGIYYIVSLMVAQAMPYRNDLLVPVGQIRDESGRIVGSQGLAIANADLDVLRGNTPRGGRVAQA